MKKQKHLLPTLALILACILWGLNPPLIKMALESMPVSISMSIRFLIASLILLPFALRTWKPLSQRDFLLLVLSAVIYNSFGSLALNIGLTKTTSINAALLGLLSPLLLYALSAVFLKERISLKTFVGVLVALGGSAIVVGQLWDNGANSSNILMGNLFIIISIFCTVVGAIMFKPLTKKTGTFQATFSSLFFGIIPVAIYATTQLSSWDIQATTTNSIVGLIGSTIVIVGANSLFFYALLYKKVQVTGVYRYLELITTIIAAWWLLSERPSSNFWIGAVLIIVGIYLAEAHRGHVKRQHLKV